MKINASLVPDFGGFPKSVIPKMLNYSLFYIFQSGNIPVKNYKVEL